MFTGESSAGFWLSRLDVRDLMAECSGDGEAKDFGGGFWWAFGITIGAGLESGGE